MTKIIIHGIGGMMGKTVQKVVNETQNCEVVAGIDPYFSGGENEFPIFTSLDDINVDCDCIIDFSTASAIDALLDYCEKTNTPLVLCTTGLSSEIKEKVKETSKKVAILNSANMSLGINLIASILDKISPLLYSSNFDIEIIEKHHNKKLDAPSGTALLLANAINDSLDDTLKLNYDRSASFEKRDKNEIGIHAVRGGTIVGEHSVIYAGLDEIIEIKHEAHSKEVFAVGAVNAAKFLKSKDYGLYNMSDLMNAL